MSLSEALSFPFKPGNIYKILPLAIVYSLFIHLVEYSTIMEAYGFGILAGLGFMAFSLFIAGYYLRVVKRVVNDNEQLPEFDNTSKDIGRGVMTMLAGVVYFFVPVILGVIGAGILGGLSNNGVLWFAFGLAMLALVIVISGAMTVGIVRYAVEERAGALFDISGNADKVISNFGAYAGLVARLFVLGFLGGIVSFVLGIIMAVLFPESVSLTFQPTQSYWLTSALFNVVLYSFSTMLALSQYHIMARFGQQIGIGDVRKSKREAAY